MGLIVPQRNLMFIYINARNVVALENNKVKESKIISGPMSRVKILNNYFKNRF